MLTLKKLKQEFAICKLHDLVDADLRKEYFLLSKTDEEISLVCPVEDVPLSVESRSYGWYVFRVEGVLDFSLIGILAKISSILAEAEIGIFVVSTYNTDYVFTRKDDFDSAMDRLSDAGYKVI